LEPHFTEHLLGINPEARVSARGLDRGCHPARPTQARTQPARRVLHPLFIALHEDEATRGSGEQANWVACWRSSLVSAVGQQRAFAGQRIPTA
jgi:hypothetical protein